MRNPQRSPSLNACAVAFLLRSPVSQDSPSNGTFHKQDFIRWEIDLAFRDSEESAPAEYPPEQPEADVLEDDGAGYGAEETELEAALIKELEDVEHQDGDDQEMEGTETAAVPAAEEDVSDAGSEDLEAESSGSEDEDLEDDEAADGEEDVEMGDDAESKNNVAAQQAQHQPELMVH
jgi:histone chaperone ASF1